MSDKPLNKYIRCSLNGCGCRINPLIWISKKHEIIYLEIAKCGSSSIKKALDISIVKEDYINAYYHRGDLNIANLRKELIELLSKIKSIEDITEDKLNYDLSLGIERGIYCFQPYFNDIDILLEKLPDFLYVSNIRDPIVRFISCFNMFSDDNQPFRKKQRESVGQLVNGGIDNLDFFIESSLKEPNHHFWPYSTFINKIKDVNNKLFINCAEMNQNWDFIKSTLNLPDFPSSAPNIYVNRSKSSIKITDLSENQIAKIESIYKDDLITFKSLI